MSVKNWQKMLWHSLPKMQQETTDLVSNNTNKMSIPFSFAHSYRYKFYVELLRSVNFRNRLIVVNNRFISINRIDNHLKYDMPMVV